MTVARGNLSVERTKRRSHSSSQIEWGLQSSAKRGLDRQLKLTDPRSLGPAVRVGALCGSGRVTTKSGTRCASCHTRALRHCVESPKRRQEREHLAVPGVDTCGSKVAGRWSRSGTCSPAPDSVTGRPSPRSVGARSTQSVATRCEKFMAWWWVVECGQNVVFFLALRVACMHVACGAFGVDPMVLITQVYAPGPTLNKRPFKEQGPSLCL